jgi:Ca2+-binding EF-hand superfamily protein
MDHSKLNHLCKLTIIGGLALSSSAFAANQSKDNSVDAEFKSMDINGDGRISPEEHAAGAKKMFDTMDANRDGKVTAEEMDAAQEKMTGKKAAKAAMSSAEKIKVIDANGDGMLSADEHATGSKTMFEKMDTNKDGFVDKAELAAGHAKMMPKGSK